MGNTINVATIKSSDNVEETADFLFEPKLKHSWSQANIVFEYTNPAIITTNKISANNGNLFSEFTFYVGC